MSGRMKFGTVAVMIAGSLALLADGEIEQVHRHDLLYVPLDGIAYRAVVRWRKNDRVGVEFVGIEPKPKFHYG